MTRIVLLLVICFFTISFVGCKNKKQDSTKETTIELKVIQLPDSGWAYQIDIDGEKHIYQNIIPVIAGYKKFKTKDDALKVGRLVVNKMKDEGTFPSIDINEIKALNIDLSD